jgi:hypothetical protein
MVKVGINHVEKIRRTKREDSRYPKDVGYGEFPPIKEG